MTHTYHTRLAFPSDFRSQSDAIDAWVYRVRHEKTHGNLWSVTKRRRAAADALLLGQPEETRSKAEPSGEIARPPLLDPNVFYLPFSSSFRETHAAETAGTGVSRECFRDPHAFSTQGVWRDARARARASMSVSFYD